ncbi:MAG TPA: transcriptional regulator GcvA [Microvirga sp.]|jgi:LysR family glycine cleavage system transcriptional activator|nr:transcriptional regulator GcvA [Microvirga sp.]
MHAPSHTDRRRLPPLNALRAFEAAARHGSFHAAADELAVTPGAVAQHVKALEAWLRLPLFRRLPSRGVVLTLAGQRYAASVSRLLDELAEATRRLVQQDNAHVLTVSTIHSFAAQWLIPRLGAFRAQNPGLDVRVVASNAMTDFAREEVDLVIRYGRGGYPGLMSELLMEETFFPVCAPALVAGGEHPLRRPEDLVHHTLLHEEGDVTIPDMIGWPQWLAAAGVRGVDPRRGPRFTHTFLALQAAAGGQGVAIVTSVLIGDDVASGRLVRPFGPDVPSPYSYYLVCPPAAAELPKVQAFWRWIKEAASVHRRGG